MSKNSYFSGYLGGLFLLSLVFATPSWANVALNFNYSLDTNGFFGAGTAARATLEAVGDFYENLLEDDLAEISPGSNDRTWTARFYHPSTGDEHEITNLYVPADTLVVYVGARDLGGMTLGQAGPGGWSAYGFSDWLNTVSTRGEGTTQGAGADDFGLWGGAMAIDLDSTWNRDYQTSPSAGENDLYSVIFHELGHVLGIGTCDSWNNLIVDGQFTGVSSVDQYGGNVPLSGAAHWAYSTQSNVFPEGAQQEASMDPDLIRGTRKVPTYLDLAGLDDLGWDIEIPPLPELPGDLNGDYFVGGDDLDVVRANWGQTVEAGNLAKGDPSGDGFVGGDDLDVVRANWGQGASPSAPNAVPEPSLAVLLAVMGLVLSLVRQLARSRGV